MAAWLRCCLGHSPDQGTHDLSSEQIKDLYDRCLKLNDGRLIVHGMFARADAINTNKRSYPKRLLAREVARYKREHIASGTALGELDHPSYASEFFRLLNVPNVSHQVLHVRWRGKELWGSIEVLPTPSGLLLWELYSRGIKLGVSSRSWASLVRGKRGACRVGDDMRLITFDFVVDPSNSGAFLVPLGKEYRRPIPCQRRATQLAHLGVGSCHMESVASLPAPKCVHEVLEKMRRQHAAADRRAREGRRAAVEPPRAGEPRAGGLGLGCGGGGGTAEEPVVSHGERPEGKPGDGKEEQQHRDHLGEQQHPNHNQQPALEQQQQAHLEQQGWEQLDPPYNLSQLQQHDEQHQQLQQQQQQEQQQEQELQTDGISTAGALAPAQPDRVPSAHAPPQPLSLRAPPSVAHPPGSMSVLDRVPAVDGCDGGRRAGSSCSVGRPTAGTGEASCGPSAAMPACATAHRPASSSSSLNGSSGGGPTVAALEGAVLDQARTAAAATAPSTIDGGAASGASAAAVTVPFDSAMPGGVLRVVSHYRATEDSWLPLDPHGRCLALHLATIATKAHVAAARGIGGAGPGPGGKQAAGAGPPHKQRPRQQERQWAGRRLSASLPSDNGSSDSLQCAGVSGRGDDSGRGAEAACMGLVGVQMQPLPPPCARGRGAQGAERSARRVQPEEVAAAGRQLPVGAPPPSAGRPGGADVDVSTTLQACENAIRQWRANLLASLLVQ